ncbi:SDR family oxidoreductase [Sphingobacterium sp. lm-10]|uniref:SDR family NAD(P)-dependent oxidoreductase n=1 Tax=Sphingobacterium sp. lm-10 TaxID=2944904 RepID=UPI0020213237|nr:SDR family oxidoreductase [Sphingobacterium sp. lm-10]MCL7987152.1 SDR family oxidoreductase [Sphingobacterium sp. lm-10]
MNVTLITGASGGIGEAIAHQFAQRKNNLLLIARSTDKLAALCTVLEKQYGIRANYLSADLTDREMPEQVYHQIKTKGFEIDTLVNNAGIGSGGEFGTRALKEEMDQIQLNVSSLVAFTQLLGIDMKQKRRGTIINIASVVAFMPMPYMATYAATKAFVRSFTEAIAQEYKPFNVHVLLFCPGLTKTNFNAAAGLDNDMGKGLGLSYENAKKILQSPEEVAEELMIALDKKKHVGVSGLKNRIGAALFSILPNRWITQVVAKRYRDKVNKK